MLKNKNLDCKQRLLASRCFKGKQPWLKTDKNLKISHHRSQLGDGILNSDCNLESFNVYVGPIDHAKLLNKIENLQTHTYSSIVAKISPKKQTRKAIKLKTQQQRD